MTSDVWDVCLIYPPGVRWEGSTPPAPAFWMHQLGVLESSSIPRLDGSLFERHVHALLPRVEATERPATGSCSSSPNPPDKSRSRESFASQA
jgi:hypothetical protein